MGWIDALHQDNPFAVAWMLQVLLAGEGVRRLHVSTLMKQMDIDESHRRANPSKPASDRRPMVMTRRCLRRAALEVDQI